MSIAEDPDRITVGQRIVLPAPATVRTNASRSSWDPDDGGSSSKPKLRFRSFLLKYSASKAQERLFNRDRQDLG
jgi:hypothetical protein